MEEYLKAWNLYGVKPRQYFNKEKKKNADFIDLSWLNERCADQKVGNGT